MENKEKKTGYGIASMILGILSIILCWVPFLGVSNGILAIVFFAMQKKRGTTGMSVAGLVTGIIGLIVSTIYMLIYSILLSVLAL